MALTVSPPEVNSCKIREALSAVLASPSFRNSPQLSSFLSYVVEKALAGKGAALKAYGIATEALGRPPSFDPVSDASVRVLASRVRSALELHYLKTGDTAEIIIELLPGSYAPQFRVRPQPVFAAPRPALREQEVVIRPSRFNSDLRGQAAARNETPRRLLILDDDAGIRPILHRIGKDSGYQVVDTAVANEFWVAYKAMAPTHIILDLVLPGADGLEIMRELGRQSAKCRITLISGVDPRLLRTSERLGREFGLDMTAAIAKPFEIEAVERAITPPVTSSALVSASELADAIETSQIVLHYQPKIAWLPGGSSQISGVEALARWNHPLKGLLLPESFIPLAEESELIVPLTHQVIDLAIRELTELSTSYPDCTMAVNIAAALLDDPVLPDLMAAKMDAVGIKRDRLTIEITESVAASQPSDPVDCIAHLRLKGFTLSMDDFGTGYSSLMRSRL